MRGAALAPLATRLPPLPSPPRPPATCTRAHGHTAGDSQWAAPWSMHIFGVESVSTKIGLTVNIFVSLSYFVSVP